MTQEKKLDDLSHLNPREGESLCAPAPGPAKVIASGKLFGGVDCHVLADKRRVITQRGVVLALTTGPDGGGRKSGNLAPYLERIPEKYSAARVGAEIAFLAPSGNVAHGITAEQFYEILVAYSEAADLGEISHPGQLRIAANCNRLVRACGKVGIVALVDEASGYQAERETGELQGLVAKYLRETPGDWTMLWDREVVQRLCDLYGIERRGNLFPAFVCNVIGRLYRLILPAEVYAAIRDRNGTGEERQGKLHQFFKSSLWRFVHNDIPFVAYMARASRTRREFWGHMHARYGGQAVQFGLDFDGDDEAAE